jgi:phospholipase/carboxylesterase
MTAFPAPTVALAGSPDPAVPLVVLLHGRGSNERDIIGLLPHLPQGPAYAAVRAPISEGGGYAWFANRGIGRPVTASLRETMDWFRGWLDSVAPAGRPIVLIGFSGGAAFAGGLLLDDPARYAGAAILYGTLPFDAGVPTTPARLAGVPVVVAQGEQDTVIPRELLDRTWQYLLGESGAPTIALRHPGGHGITADSLETVAGWLAERLDFLARRGVPTPGPTVWSGLPDGRLPARVGARPAVTPGIPQEQRSDNAPRDLQERLFDLVAALPGVATRQSAISVPGARGLMLDQQQRGTDADAFLVPAAGEFAHVHPGYDGSMHLALPPALAADLVAKGWGVAHPLAGVRLTPGFVMIFGPRDDAELETVLGVVTTAHAWASGRLTTANA